MSTDTHSRGLVPRRRRDCEGARHTAGTRTGCARARPRHATRAARRWWRRRRRRRRAAAPRPRRGAARGQPPSRGCRAPRRARASTRRRARRRRRKTAPASASGGRAAATRAVAAGAPSGPRGAAQQVSSPRARARARATRSRTPPRAPRGQPLATTADGAEPAQPLRQVAGEHAARCWRAACVRHNAVAVTARGHAATNARRNGRVPG